MPLLNYDQDSVPELTTLPDGEHEVKIVAINVGQQDGTKGQSYWMRVSLEAVADEMAKNFSDFMMLPDFEDPEVKKKTNIQRQNRIDSFIKAFNLPWPFDTDDPKCIEECIGKTGYAVLNSKDDETYGLQNNVKSYMIAR